MEIYAVTHPGLKRRENQDRYLVRKFDTRSLLLAVADGMGGEAGGAQAAQLALEAITYFAPDFPSIEPNFKKVFQAASQKILEEAQKDPNLQGMGTTLTAFFLKNRVAHWAHVGDCRIYLFRKGLLTQITEDQTFVNSLFKDGLITADEAAVHPMKNMLVQCVGCGPMVVATGQFKVDPGDWVFLSTDGLHHEVAEDVLVSILTSEGTIQKKLDDLVRAALDSEGKDNITIAGVSL